MLRPRYGAVTAVLAAVLAIAAGGCRGGAQPAQQQGGGRGSTPTPVSVAMAARKDAPIYMRTFGTVKPYATVQIRPQVTGLLKEVLVREGQQVSVGTPLFHIDRRPFELALEQAQANLDRDRAQSTNAQRDLARVEELFRRQAAARDELDKTRTAAEAAAAVVKADDAAVKVAALQLEYAQIDSPVAGVVGSFAVDAGNVVKANDTTLVTINQVAPIRVVFALPQRALPMVRQEMSQRTLPVSVTVPGVEKPIDGKLTFLDNTVDKSTGTINLEATFDNTHLTLWPGQFVNVSLLVRVERGAVVVPAEAIQTGQQGQFVFVVRDGKAAQQAVTTGERLDGQIIVTSGLEGDEQVVTDGQMRLAPGFKVAVKPPVSSAPASSPAGEAPVADAAAVSP